jgi:hypothetical protein
MKEDSRKGNSAGESVQKSWFVIMTAFGSIFFLTCLFLAMRGVMDLGGFVAKGGPYVIAHEAPGYVWIIPVSIFGLVLMAITLISTFDRRGGMDLLTPLLLPAMFLSLGWNFFEYSLFKFDYILWGWLVCGVLFFAIGGLPLVLMTKKYPPATILGNYGNNLRTVMLQAAGIILGIICGFFFFQAIS